MRRKILSAEQPKRRRKKKSDVTAPVVSTGSTLLDLAISGGVQRGGGIPGGIFVEIFGPSGSGKTVILCQIAGNVKKLGGSLMFKDPEARLNRQFARLFDLDIDAIDYEIPSTVSEVFNSIRKWEPPVNGSVMSGVFVDSLAALSTEMEMDDKDQYGMRRAKEFSEGLRKTCRDLPKKNFLMVASNQIRQNIDAGQFGMKFKSPGGTAVEFYSSLRLRMLNTDKMKLKVKVAGREVQKVIGVKTEIQVFKSSIWKPHNIAPVIIDFDYGIDDIQQNLQYIKDFTRSTVYMVNDQALDKSMSRAINIVEDEGLEDELREQVIDLWEEIEKKFVRRRKPKLK